jgi:hypothetical protein
MTAPYIDTSALAKWYLPEVLSDRFEEYVNRHEYCWISRLTVLEFRCLLGRRLREGDLDKRSERAVHAAFQRDLVDGAMRILPVEDAHVTAAMDLLERLPAIPLRSLDALHLAVARKAGLDEVATADRVQARAAVRLGMRVVRFYSR